VRELLGLEDLLLQVRLRLEQLVLMLLQLELLPELRRALHLPVLVPLVFVDLLLQARLHLAQLVLVLLQLGQRLALHQALRLLAPELLALVDLLLQAQLRLAQLVLVRQQLELLPELRRALHLHPLVPVRLGLEDLRLQVRLQLERRLGQHQVLRLPAPELLELESPLLQLGLEPAQHQAPRRLVLVLLALADLPLQARLRLVQLVLV
jgi:hypothetical protein